MSLVGERRRSKDVEARRENLLDDASTVFYQLSALFVLPPEIV